MFRRNEKQTKIPNFVMCQHDWRGKVKDACFRQSKSPSCFKGIKYLEVKYEFNKKSWLRSEIFDRWMKAMDKQMRQQHRKIAKLIDNYPINSKDCGGKLKTVSVIFFPPNCTKICSPWISE
ncbi:hypothetical protein AVEN_3844-1 [Araneus ventricosus]|uniref:DDE-1 domain-containing protein n=1 Tax=Araneus ventricosus TaxID=182803 RepID=A0A4Y2GPZ1_ARAVE|nr:hypothetical protein AVEN_3844-1 [Araneus ventricosus]